MSRALLSLAVAATAVAVIAAMAGPTFSAFSGATSNPANTFAAAASFGGCASAGTVTASANIDSWIDQASQGSNFGNDQILKVKRETGSKANRALVRFNLPAVPPGCTVTGATLRLYRGPRRRAGRSRRFGSRAVGPRAGCAGTTSPGPRPRRPRARACRAGTSGP